MYECMVVAAVIGNVIIIVFLICVPKVMLMMYSLFVCSCYVINFMVTSLTRPGEGGCLSIIDTVNITATI